LDDLFCDALVILVPGLKKKVTSCFLFKRRNNNFEGTQQQLPLPDTLFAFYVKSESEEDCGFSSDKRYLINVSVSLGSK
jgi:hypothetical protein